VSQATPRPWQPPDGIEWEGNVPPWERPVQRRSLSTALLREEMRARDLDRRILALLRRAYYEDVRRYERLRAVGVRCPRPRHYSEQATYRQAMRRLTTAPAPLTATRAAPPHDPAANDHVSFCGLRPPWPSERWVAT
jgi:hypothetical protein